MAAIEFLIIGVTIVMGFLADKMFHKTKISAVIILIAFGFLLGPVFGLLDVSEESVIKSILPFIASIALIFLLFDGGFEFDIFRVAREIPKSMLFTFLVFILGTAFISGFIVISLGWGIMSGALLGAVVGGSSGAVVISLMEKTKFRKETKSLVTVESTLTDALVIITAVIIIQLITEVAGNFTIGTIAGLFLSSFSNAIVLGILAGMIWIIFSNKFEMANYSYMLMLALLFGLFAVTEEVGGSGGIAVFTFGIVLGNAKKMAKFAKLESINPVSRTSKLFQEEVTFFIRTFFFVYVGLLMSISFFTIDVFLISIGIIMLVLIARWAITRLLLPELPGNDKHIVIAMMPRGLAAAVVATLPIRSGIVLDNFQEYVFTVILLTNIIATIGIFLFDRNGENGEKEKHHKEIK